MKTTISVLVSSQVEVEVDWEDGLDPLEDNPSQAMLKKAEGAVWDLLEKAGLDGNTEVNAI